MNNNFLSQSPTSLMGHCQSVCGHETEVDEVTSFEVRKGNTVGQLGALRSVSVHEDNVKKIIRSAISQPKHGLLSHKVISETDSPSKTFTLSKTPDPQSIDYLHCARLFVSSMVPKGDVRLTAPSSFQDIASLAQTVAQVGSRVLLPFFPTTGTVLGHCVPLLFCISACTNRVAGKIAGKPIPIGSEADFNNIGIKSDYPLNGNYRLTKDLDGSQLHSVGRSLSNPEYRFYSPNSIFTGTFLGDCKIHNLESFLDGNCKIHNLESSLFYSVKGGEIRDLILVDPQITCPIETECTSGAIVDFMEEAHIENIIVVGGKLSAPPPSAKFIYSSFIAGYISKGASIAHITLSNVSINSVVNATFGGIVGYVSNEQGVVTIINITITDSEVFANGGYASLILGKSDKSTSIVVIEDVDIQNTRIKASHDGYAGICGRRVSLKNIQGHVIDIDADSGGKAAFGSSKHYQGDISGVECRSCNITADGGIVGIGSAYVQADAPLTIQGISAVNSSCTMSGNGKAALGYAECHAASDVYITLKNNTVSDFKCVRLPMTGMAKTVTTPVPTTTPVGTAEVYNNTTSSFSKTTATLSSYIAAPMLIGCSVAASVGLAATTYCAGSWLYHACKKGERGWKLAKAPVSDLYSLYNHCFRQRSYDAAHQQETVTDENTTL